MATRANSSRERILSTAEAIILQKGFAGTSIDDILEKAAITKGGFFYHFHGKADLARALVERYLRMDMDVYNDLWRRADELSEDPLQRMLIFLKLFAEMVGGMNEVHPGCLAAGFTYEIQQFDDQIREMMREGMLEWRQMAAERIEAIMLKYPPRSETTLETLADMFATVVEGGIILARIYDNNTVLINQVLSYRNYLRMLFDPAVTWKPVRADGAGVEQV